MSLEKRALKGVLSLSLLKAIDYIVPLILIPYIIHVLGLEFYGEYAYVQVIAIFLAFSADYSLPTVGVQYISQKKNRSYVSNYVSSLIAFKLFNVVFFTLIIFITVKVFDFTPSNLFLCGVFVYLGLSLQNSWLYQAFEIYKPLIVLSGSSRVICLIITPFFVNDVSDQYEFLIIQSAMYFIPGLFSLIYVFSRFEFGLRKVKKRYIYHMLKNGMYVFQYRVINAAVLPTNNYFIFMFADAKILGVYNLIMKCLSALVNFITPISLSVQPILAETKSKNRCELKVFFASIQKKIALISVLLSIILFFGVSIYLNIYNEIGNDYSIYILIMFLCLTLIPHALNGLYSQTLNLFGWSKFVRNLIFLISVVSLSILPLMVIRFQAIGIGLVSLFMYFTMLTFMYLRLREEFEK